MAKARSSQRTRRRERREAIVISAQEAHRKESLVEFLARSPLRGSGLRIERIKDQPRKIEL